MATTLHTVARAVGLQVPPEVGWRELTFSNRAADGLAHLLATGRESLPKGAHPRLLH
jgi:hypothetical protein